jgi:hypothetical protein
MEKIQSVVFGLGRIGMLYGLEKKRIQPASHIEAIKNNKKFNLTGVCDPSKDSRDLFVKKYGKHNNLFDSHIELLLFLKKNNINPQLFVIATPENTHFQIIKDIVKIFNNPKKKSIIFCEKPLTKNIESAKEIKKILNNSNYELIVNHTRRWSKIWNLCHKKIRNIGKIQRAIFIYSTSPENKSVDQMRDGIHIADLINWLDIKDKIQVKRVSLPYLVYDLHVWGDVGKMEVLNNGEKLNMYNKQKSKRFEGFSELNLVSKSEFNDSTLKNAYSEFFKFFNSNNHKLSTNLQDAINAMDTFKRYVYEKSFK